MNAIQKKIEAIEALVAKRTGITTTKQFRIGIFKAQPHPELLGVVDITGQPLDGTHFDVTMCEKFLPLLDPKYLYVSMRGGRGSGKSETTAMILLLQAYYKPLKVLCFREVQNSIKDSVYQNLLDRIRDTPGVRIDVVSLDS